MSTRAYRLYASPDSANLVVRIYLRELGAPFDVVPVDRSRNEQRDPAYLRLNPQGLLPVLVDGDTAVFETAAILLHLGDAHPGALPAPGTPARAKLYQWLFFLSNTLHADLRVNFYTHRHTADAAAIPAIRSATRGRLLDHFAVLDDALAASGGKTLLAWGLTPCDFYLAACARWAVLYPPEGALRERRPVDFPHLHTLLESLEARSAVRAACREEGLDGRVFTAPRLPVTPEGTR